MAIVDKVIVNGGANQTDDVKVTLDGEAIPLPSGAATSANQTTIIGHVDGIESLLTTVDADTSNLDVALSTRLKPADTLAGVTTLGTITNVVHVDDNAGSLTVDGSVTANAGTNLNTSALALESGGNLADIKAKTDNIPALGQALAAASVPVVLTAAQISTITPPAAITGFATSANQSTEITALGTIDTSVNTLLKPASTLSAVTTVGTITNVVHVDDNGSTVSIDDGAGSITVDGTVAVTNAGTFVVQENGAALTSLQLIDDAIYTDGSGTVVKGIAILGQDGTNPQAIKTDSAGELQVDVLTMPSVAVTGTFWQATQPVSAASLPLPSGAATSALQTQPGVDIGDVTINNASGASAVNIQDGGNSLTVDNGGTFAVQASGDVAHDSGDSGNPIKVGFQALSALPTAVTTADRANGISDLWGRQLTSHIDPTMQTYKVFNATTSQTGTDVWSPTSGKKIAITSVVIGTYATTAARLLLWFGDNADTTYTAGTDQLVIGASFAPSSTVKPGLVFSPSFPIFCTTANRELHVTTDAALSVDITVYGYEY